MKRCQAGESRYAKWHPDKPTIFIREGEEYRVHDSLTDDDHWIMLDSGASDTRVDEEERPPLICGAETSTGATCERSVRSENETCWQH